MNMNHRIPSVQLVNYICVVFVTSYSYMAFCLRGLAWLSSQKEVTVSSCSCLLICKLRYMNSEYGEQFRLLS